MWRALQSIRGFAKSGNGKTNTVGLSDAVLKQFERDPALLSAAAQANTKHAHLQAQFAQDLKRDEGNLVQYLHRGFLNFYGKDSVMPYVPIAAQGPWVITSHGAVVYDSGGYGMLGFGHNPSSVLTAMSEPQAMANIMTPNFEMANFMRRMRAEVGHSRAPSNPRAAASDAFGDNCPYESFVCLNSGSESVSLGMRIMDIDAKVMTDADGPHPNRRRALVSLKGSFHGRTDRPARVSDSSASTYRKHLASFQDGERTVTVEPNNIEDLRQTLGEMDADDIHIEGIFMEPVMGEGNPGCAITREFYDEARKLTDKYRSLLLVDSIQAGLRGTGCLSLMDYPGFQSAEPPDFETYSKALNGGQFSLSVLALGPRVPEIYVMGLYGNTMTTNPRSLAVANAVLDEVTPDLRTNVVQQGLYFKEQLAKLGERHPDAVADVTGTGLLVALHLQSGWPVVGGFESIESRCRRKGLNVIHGGANALRFTPWFHVTEPEVDLIVSVVEEAINEYRSEASA